MGVASSLTRALRAGDVKVQGEKESERARETYIRLAWALNITLRARLIGPQSRRRPVSFITLPRIFVAERHNGRRARRAGIGATRPACHLQTLCAAAAAPAAAGLVMLYVEKRRGAFLAGISFRVKGG